MMAMAMLVAAVVMLTLVTPCAAAAAAVLKQTFKQALERAMIKIDVQSAVTWPYFRAR